MGIIKQNDRTNANLFLKLNPDILENENKNKKNPQIPQMNKEPEANRI